MISYYILSLKPLAWLPASLQTLYWMAALLLGWLAAILYWSFDIGFVRVFNTVRISILGSVLNKEVPTPDVIFLFGA